MSSLMYISTIKKFLSQSISYLVSRTLGCLNSHTTFYPGKIGSSSISSIHIVIVAFFTRDSDRLSID